ncbi:sensor histidine kinase [Pseudonocardia nigra]|uniref:sensor histidine kinase n=1 Tax=Pseudonocardia nigra TaxID=1921578 RepID=UPI001C5E48DC|nr:ATP-binding protein [Pseudonocardia nigra]
MAPRQAVRAAAVETLAQLVLITGAVLLVIGLQSAPGVVERTFAVLAFAAGVSATILLAVGAYMSGSDTARRIAEGVGLYVGTVLLLRTVGAGERGMWAVFGSLAVLGVIALLVLAVRGSSTRDRTVAVVFGLAVLAAAAAAVGTLVAPGLVLPAPVVRTVDLVAWSGVGAAAVLLLAAGVGGGGPLMRRIALGFVTLAIAHAIRFVARDGGTSGAAVSALVLAAVAMFLVAAVPFLLATARTVSRQGAELERLQRMLDAPEPAGQAGTAVATVLRELAVVHSGGLLAVDVDVDGEPRVAAPPAVLADVLTHLLADCATNTPGGRVRIRALSRGRHVRIEVADDGPGLTPDSMAVLLRRGQEGGTPDGPGAGLARSADIVGRHQGTFTVRYGDHGCTAVLDLPASDCAAPVPTVVV